MKKMISYIVLDKRYWRWSLFFIGMLFWYGIINRVNGGWRHEYYVLKMAFDGALPLVPGMVFVYVSWYVQLLLVALYLFYLDYHKAHRQRQHTVRLQFSDEAESYTSLRFQDAAFLRLLRTASAVILLASVIFLLVPTWVERPHLSEESGLAWSLLRSIYAVDYPTNAFPSLHVAVSFVFTFFFCEHVPSRKYPWTIPFMLVWTVLIILSTVFIYQHYWPDVFGGITLAILVIWVENDYSQRYPA